MPSTYSTGYPKRMFHFEQPNGGGGDTYGQRLVGTSGCLIDFEQGGRLREHVQTWASSDCSNKQTIANYGITVLKSTLDCHMPIQCPKKGSHIWIYMMGVDTTEAKYQLHASGPGPAGINAGNCARIGDTDSVQVTFTTLPRTAMRSIELLGLSSFLWGINTASPVHTTADRTAYIITTSTA